MNNSEKLNFSCRKKSKIFNQNQLKSKKSKPKIKLKHPSFMKQLSHKTNPKSNKSNKCLLQSSKNTNKKSKLWKNNTNNLKISTKHSNNKIQDFMMESIFSLKKKLNFKTSQKKPNRSNQNSRMNLLSSKRINKFWIKKLRLKLFWRNN